MTFYRLLPYDYPLDYQGITEVFPTIREVHTRVYKNYGGDLHAGVGQLIAATHDITGLVIKCAAVEYGSERTQYSNRVYQFFERKGPVTSYSLPASYKLYVIPPIGGSNLNVMLHPWKRKPRNPNKTWSFAHIEAGSEFVREVPLDEILKAAKHNYAYST